MFLGIETSSRLIFEGSSPSEGRGLWPLPIVTPVAMGAKVPGELTQSLPDEGFSLLETARIMFREDFFDPVTRIRRGRFYRRDTGPLHMPWETSPHPALNLQGLAVYRNEIAPAFSQNLNSHTGRLRVPDLLTFQSFSLRDELHDFRPEHMLVVLGTKQVSTRWNLVDVETISTGEELVTLKARNLFGILPEFRGAAIENDDNAKIHEALEKLADTIYRAGPESVVDCARDLASAVVLTILRQEGVVLKSDELDLGPATKRLADDPRLSKFGIVVSAAQIIQRLHPRRKPSEQQRRNGLHALREKDADLAVLCVGTMLRDLGWAEWV